MPSRQDWKRLARAALDLIGSGHFSPEYPGLFRPLVDLLLHDGDQDAWTHRAVLNIAGAGPFSSDRTVGEYAARIWGVTGSGVT